jgi:hypothetical protein
MQIRRSTWATLMALLVTGCGTSPATVHHSENPHAGASANPSSFSPEENVKVVAAGAAPSPTGTVAFAVLESAPGIENQALSVDVNLSAISKNGFAPAHATVHVSEIGPGTEQAVTAPVSLPNGDEIASVSAAISGWHAVSITSSQVHAETPAFVADPIQPTATVKVSSAVSLAATVVVICWSPSNAILGGGEKDVTLVAGAATTLSITLALQDTPDHCTGYARPSQ